MSNHEESLANAFDGQAAKFERAPVQTDPHALTRLVEFSAFPEESSLIDAGCGPGLVSEAFLQKGHRVFGVDLSAEMIARARLRASRYEGLGRFEQGSLFDPMVEKAGPFDGAISRYVLHHVVNPIEFVERQIELLRKGGVLVLADHTTDPDLALADRHQKLEWMRDVTHTRNLTCDQIATLFEKAGLRDVQSVEESFSLDFDEWFDRGTPGVEKEELRAAMLQEPRPRGFEALELDDGSVRIDCFRATVRGVKN